LLRDSDVKVCGVVGFPHGANLPEVKALEAALAIKNGAQELDMVLNIGALRSKDYDLVERDIRGVVKVARQRVKVKVIIETGYLNRVQQKVACHLIAKAGAEFVKTSTGFGPRGARLQDIIFLKRVTKGRLKIKVSGGIRDLESTLRFIAHGADRIGTSYGPQILRQMV
jgi:deoxyribose-phosphate aldolase